MKRGRFEVCLKCGSPVTEATRTRHGCPGRWKTNAELWQEELRSMPKSIRGDAARMVAAPDFMPRKGR